jgi:hypothetical protein
MGVEHPAPGEFETDPVDPWQWPPIGGENPTRQVDGDRRRVRPRKRFRGDSAVEVKNNGAESLPELAPLATYMTLAPFIGADEAYERAIEESDKW